MDTADNYLAHNIKKITSTNELTTFKCLFSFSSYY